MTALATPVGPSRLRRIGALAAAETQPATIRFTLDDGVPPPPVPAGVHVVSAGPQVEWHTRALQPALARLLAWAAAYGVVLRGLQARSASLEQAFLAVADAE